MSLRVLPAIVLALAGTSALAGTPAPESTGPGPEDSALLPGAALVPLAGRVSLPLARSPFGLRTPDAEAVSELSGIRFQLGGAAAGLPDGTSAWIFGGDAGLATLPFPMPDAGPLAPADRALGFGAEYHAGPWTIGGGIATSLSDPGLAGWGFWATYSVAPGIGGTLGIAGEDPAATDPATSVMGYLRIGF